VIRSLIPFTQLTRTEMPQFRVTRLPLLLGGSEIAVGEVVAVDAFPNRVRLRQMYEQRRIEPTIAPKNSRQAARERQEAQRARESESAGSGPVSPVAASVASQDLLRAPVQSDFDSPAIPVSEESEPGSKPSAYTPPRRGKRP